MGRCLCLASAAVWAAQSLLDLTASCTASQALAYAAVLCRVWSLGLYRSTCHGPSTCLCRGPGCGNCQITDSSVLLQSSTSLNTTIQLPNVSHVSRKLHITWVLSGSHLVCLGIQVKTNNSTLWLEFSRPLSTATILITKNQHTPPQGITT